MSPATLLLLGFLVLQSGADAEPSATAASAREQLVPRAPCKQVSVRTVDGAQRVSISAQDADLRELLLCLAKIGRVNIVLDQSVAGKVTAEISDVSWHQALCAVLESRGLAVDIDGLPPCPREISPMSQVQKEGSEVAESKD